MVSTLSPVLTSIQAAIPPAALPYVANAVKFAIPMALSYVVTKVVKVVFHDGFGVRNGTGASTAIKFIAFVAGVSASFLVIKHLNFVPIFNVTGLSYIALGFVVGTVTAVSALVLPRVISSPINLVLGGISMGEHWRWVQVLNMGISSIMYANDATI